MKCAAFIALLLFLALLAPLSRAGDAPNWMHALTNAPLPAHDEKTEAVLLYSEEILVIESNGKMKEIDRAAYKILRPSGRHFGEQSFGFDPETRINHLRGWCIPAQGKDFEVKEKERRLRSVPFSDNVAAVLLASAS